MNSIKFSRITRIILVSTLCLALGLGALGATPASAAHKSRREQMLSLLNKARTNRNIGRLHMQRKVARRAAGHSRDMAKRHRLYHTNPLSRQVRGLRWRIVGENVGVGSSVEGLHRAFMRSKAHKHNVLNRSFHRVGIGFKTDSRGYQFVTLVFYG
jgi:uncharacterized protein YkwD